MPNNEDNPKTDTTNQKSTQRIPLRAFFVNYINRVFDINTQAKRAVGADNDEKTGRTVSSVLPVLRVDSSFISRAYLPCCKDRFSELRGKVPRRAHLLRIPLLKKQSGEYARPRFVLRKLSRALLRCCRL